MYLILRGGGGIAVLARFLAFSSVSKSKPKVNGEGGGGGSRARRAEWGGYGMGGCSVLPPLDIFEKRSKMVPSGVQIKPYP